jgi:hypothetical protein
VTAGVPDGQTLFELVLADHFERPAVHFAMHLCWSLERGGSRALSSEHLRRWVEHHPDWQNPTVRHWVVDLAFANEPSGDVPNKPDYRVRPS